MGGEAARGLNSRLAGGTHYFKISAGVECRRGWWWERRPLLPKLETIHYQLSGHMSYRDNFGLHIQCGPMFF